MIPEQKDTKLGNKKRSNLFWIIIFDHRYLGVWVLVVISVLSSLITLVYNSIAFSCQLSFMQNFLIPLFGTSLLLSEIKPVSQAQRYIFGGLSGSLIGGVSGMAFLLMGRINYFCLGGRETAFAVQGHPVPPLTLELFLVGMSSQVVILFIMVIISALAGFIAAILPIKDHSDMKT